MKNFKKVLIPLCLLLYGTTIHAQEAVATSGGDASSDDGSSVSYTIGQLVSSTILTEYGSVAPGVQQPYEIWTISGLDNKDISLECIVYPNPTSSNVILKVENFNKENLTYHLYNANGKLLKRQKVIDRETSIDMDHLGTAIYFLKVTEGNSEVIIFKINKK